MRLGVTSAQIGHLKWCLPPDLDARLEAMSPETQEYIKETLQRHLERFTGILIAALNLRQNATEAFAVIEVDVTKLALKLLALCEGDGEWRLVETRPPTDEELRRFLPGLFKAQSPP